MKYVIEIEDEPFGRNDDPNIPHGMDELYRAKGFNSLVFDKEGLDKLTPIDEALEEAYQKGLHAGESKCEYCDEYKRGLDDTWKAIMKIAKMSDRERMIHFGEVWISKILNAYSLEQIFTILEKSEFEPDEIKVSDIITDGKINYLVTDITDKSYIALQGTDFEPVYIGKDYIKYYHNLHDSKDMTKIIEEISKAVKSEQQERLCISCEHCNSSDTMRCVHYRNYDKWEQKGGAE